MRWTSAALLVLLFPSGALAAAMPEPTPPVPLPGLVVSGAASATDVHLGIHCARTNLADDSSVCHFEMRASLRAIDDVQVQWPDGARATLDGEPASGFATLTAGRIATITLAFDRDLTIGTSEDDGAWVIWAPRARHFLLGESSITHRHGDGASGELFGGGEVAIEGALHVEAATGPVEATVGGLHVDGTMDVTDPHGDIAIGIDAPSDAPRILQNGGPYAGIGMWGPIDEDDAPVAMRIGYEIAFADFVMLGVAFETDFDAIAESVLVELASPELAIIIPSVSVGVGAVFRQLGPRDADAALRLALGYQYFCIGVYTSFDYWPAIGEWTFAAGGRFSI